MRKEHARSKTSGGRCGLVQPAADRARSRATGRVGRPWQSEGTDQRLTYGLLCWPGSQQLGSWQQTSLSVSSSVRRRGTAGASAACQQRPMAPWQHMVTAPAQLHPRTRAPAHQRISTVPAPQQPSSPAAQQQHSSSTAAATQQQPSSSTAAAQQQHSSSAVAALWGAAVRAAPVGWGGGADSWLPGALQPARPRPQSPVVGPVTRRRLHRGWATQQLRARGRVGGGRVGAAAPLFPAN